MAKNTTNWFAGTSAAQTIFNAIVKANSTTVTANSTTVTTTGMTSSQIGTHFNDMKNNTNWSPA